MKKIARVSISILLASSGLLFAGQAANAMPCDGPGCDGSSNTGYPGGKPPNISCSIRVITPEVPAIPGHPAVGFEKVTPAVTETLYEFIFANEHSNSQHKPRWEKKGWNADSNPNSKGWTSTGNSKVETITEEKKEYILISPKVEDVAAIPAVTEEECITQPSVPVPPTKTPSEVTVPVVPVVEDLTYPAAPPATKDRVSPNVAPAPSAPLAQVGVATSVEAVTTPAELASTGFNIGAFLVSILALGTGVGLIRLKRKLA